MKHKIRVEVPVERRGLFGRQKTVMETQTIWVDEKTYRKIRSEKGEQGRQPFSLEELIFYDEIFDD